MDRKISIIVPVYNVENYLPKCVESIINQSYTNLEIILVNDGSPDKCGEICDYYAAKDRRIIVIHKENGGLSDARNAGLDIASGDFVSFIDSDDYIHEKFYEILINLIISSNAEIAQCQFLKVYEEYNNVNNETQDSILNTITINNTEALNNLYNDNYVNTVVVWNKLYKLELFKDIRFPKGKVHEDEYTTYKLLYSSKKLILTSMPLYYYLQRSNSIMGEKFNVKNLDVLYAYSNQITFYEKNNLIKLKSKATQRLEGLIRIFMGKALISEIENRDHVFLFLLNYYRDNFLYFNNHLDGFGRKKIIMYLYQYSPIFIVKRISKILNLRYK